MKLTRILRNGTAALLIAAVPVTSSIAATRPNAAVPMAGSAVSTAAYDDDGHDESIGWIGLAAGVLLIGLFALLVLGDDDDDEDELSPG